MDSFDAMVARLAAAADTHLEQCIAKAQEQAAVNGGGLRVERYHNRHVIVITDTVPSGTVEHVRINEYYDLKEPK